MERAFDGALYLERNPDVRAAGIEPLAHYLRYGWAEGRAPNSWLDEQHYRRQAGLAPEDRISALAHYLALRPVRGRWSYFGARPAAQLQGASERPGCAAFSSGAFGICRIPTCGLLRPNRPSPEA